MKTQITAGLAAALFAVACGGSSRMAMSDDRMAMQRHAQRTGASAQRFGSEAADTAVGAGSTVVNAAQTAGNAMLFGAREVGEAITGEESQSAERARRRMEEQARQTGRAAQRTGESAVDATAAAGRTGYHAGATTVNAAEVGVERIRGNDQREREAQARGGGPAQHGFDLRCQPIAGSDEMRCRRIMP